VELEPRTGKWESFGWEVRAVDGHDHEQLLAALQEPGSSRPVCVIASTVKGKGVSFMENRAEWHHKVPSSEQIEAAREELST
jgi:transketolase